MCADTWEAEGRRWVWWALALVVGCAPRPAAEGGADAAPAAAADAAAPAEAVDADARGADLEARLWAAYDALGSTAPPRTRHLRPDGRPQYINRLVLEASPYLRQHAHNPVDWYPWGDEAFERARRLDRPILLSVGYATCHWCHVMARESFDDPEIAAFVNAHFVPVKVDREARPDVDAVYMRALRLLSSGGGWPLTAALMPDGRPFFAGTYLPPRDGDRGARKGLLTVLRELSAAYRDARSALLERAAQVSRRLRDDAAPRPPAGVPGAAAMHAAYRRLTRTFDAQAGGFGRGPKFPRPTTLTFLLRYARRAPDSEARVIVEATLSRMAQGALRDHLGGGFHRYTVDPRWRVPHFEKMLTDQAQLAVVYLEAAQATGRADLAAVARETLAALLRDFARPDGGFASALDAESEDADGRAVEGLYYTWTPAELQAVLGADAAAFAKAYRVTAPGAIDGRSVLRRRLDAPDLTNAAFTDARRRLRAARSARRPPAVDTKVVVAHNGLVLSALARAALVLDDAALRARAEALGAYLLDHARGSDGRVGRLVRDGEPAGPGFLEDHAFVVQGLLDLFEATGAARWHTAARDLQAAQDAHFAAPAGGYFHTADDHERLLLRTRPAEDGAEPSGNAVSALNLLRLAELANDEAARARGHAVLAAFGAPTGAGAPAREALLSAADFALGPVRQIVVVGPAPDALLAVVRRTYLPNHALVVAARPEDHPLAADKPARDGRATAYVCRRGRCERPTRDPAELQRQLAVVEPLAGD